MYHLYLHMKMEANLLNSVKCFVLVKEKNHPKRTEVTPLLPSVEQIRPRSCDHPWGFAWSKPSSPLLGGTQTPAEMSEPGWQQLVPHLLALERGWWTLGSAGGVTSWCSCFFVQSRKTFYFSRLSICTCLAASLHSAARATRPWSGKVSSAGF